MSSDCRNCKNCNKCRKWVKPDTFNGRSQFLGTVAKTNNMITVTDSCTGTSILVDKLFDIETIDVPITNNIYSAYLAAPYIESITINKSTGLKLYSSDASMGIDLEDNINGIDLISNDGVPTAGSTGPQGQTGVGITGAQGIQGIQGNTGIATTYADGSAGAPSISFTGDSNTGIYRTGANSIGIATGGSNRLTITSTNTTATGSITVTAGAANRNVLISDANGVFTAAPYLLNDFNNVIITNPQIQDVLGYNALFWDNRQQTQQPVTGGNVYRSESSIQTTTFYNDPGSESSITLLSDEVLTPNIALFENINNRNEWLLNANGTLNFTFHIDGIEYIDDTGGEYRIYKNSVLVQAEVFNPGGHVLDFTYSDFGGSGDIYELRVLVLATAYTLATNVGSTINIEYTP